MANLDYGDLHKFRASLGVALIISAGVLPWFLLSETFDLYVEESKLKFLTPSAKATIVERQSWVEFMVKYWPWLSAFMVVAGLIILICALKKWKKMQDILDERNAFELQKIREAYDLSPEEVKEKGREELSEVLVSTQLAAKESNIQLGQLSTEGVDKYLEVENKLIERMKSSVPSSFEVLSHKRIGGRDFDAIIAGKTEKFDILVEIKYVQKTLSKNLYYRIRDRIVSTRLDYEGETGRQSIGLLVVVVEDSSFVEELKTNWKVKGAFTVPMLIIERANIDKVNFSKVIDLEVRPQIHVWR